MKFRAKILPLILCFVLTLAFATAPMLTLTASADGDYTVSFSVPTGVDALSTQTGAAITLPTADVPDGKTDYAFVGWAEDVVSDTTTSPAIYEAGAIYKPTQNTTLYALYTYSSDNVVYTLKDLTDISISDVIIITMTTDAGVTYALYNANGSSAAPTAVEVLVSNRVISKASDEIKWNVNASGGEYVFYPNGTTSKWLYCTNTNNGVRVGTNTNKIFTVDVDSGYLKHTATSRYVGVFTTNPDWRCYTSTSTNIKDQTLAFYVESREVYYTTLTCEHEYDDGVVTTAPTCAKIGVKTYTCTHCGQHSYTEEIPIIDHNYVDGTCTMCHGVDPATLDFSGRYYIFTKRSSGNYFYMTSDLGSSSTKRYQSVDSGLNTLPEAISESAHGCVFVIDKNEEDNTYRIYVDGFAGEEKYLGWTSGNSGTLVDEESAAVLNIEYLDGYYNISLADGTRYLAMNNSTGNDYFAFYTSLTVAGNLCLIDAAELETELTGASMTIGADLSMNYYVAIGSGDSIEDYSMRFTMNGESVAVTEYSVKDGEYVFTFCGIAPQCMGDNIKAELLLSGEAVAQKDNFSVKAYADALLSLTDSESELYALLVDMLHYGAAAQEYKNYKTESLVNAGISESTTEDPTETVKNVGEAVNGEPAFTAAGVRFDYNNKIYVKLKAPSLEGLSVTFNGVAATIEEIGDGVYIAYSGAISAVEFADEYTVNLEVGGEIVHTLTYSVDSYAYSMVNSSTASETMKNLARALYHYGVSARAYN